MKSKDLVIPLVVAAGLILLLLYDRKLLKKEIFILRKKVKESDHLYNEIEIKLSELLTSDPDLDSDIKEEIASIVALINIREETKALSVLAKIIETLLKELYSDDQEFKEYCRSKKLKPTFHTYLEFAKKKGVIKNEDYHYLSALKLIRNEEQHELNVKKDQSKIVTSFITGIAFVIELRKIVKRVISERIATTD